MKTLPKKLILFFLIIFSPILVNAEISADINVKNAFNGGDVMSFNYSISSDKDLAVSFLPVITCPSLMLPAFAVENATLSANTPFYGMYEYLQVNEQMEHENCTAAIQILEPENFTIVKEFLLNASPFFDFRPKFCINENCTGEKMVFIKGEKVYIQYDSSIPDITINSTLTYPSGKTVKLDLPHSMDAENVGTYDISITVSKENYKTISNTYQFGVVEEEANIQFREEKRESKAGSYLLPVFIIAAVFLIVVLYVKLRKNKKVPKS